MTTHIAFPPRHLSDFELIARVKDLVGRERCSTACLVAHLAEMEERQLHLAEGCASMFTYCTEMLHLSEHAAYGRIAAARAARRYPIILEKLADGSIHLTAVSLLAKHLTEENHRDLIEQATHRTKRQIQEIIARIRPRPAVATSVRKVAIPDRNRPEACSQLSSTFDLTGVAAPPVTDSAPPAQPSEFLFRSAQPAPGLGAGHVSADPPAGNRLSGTAVATRTQVEPLAPERYRVQFTADAETHALLCQARELLRHQIPGGDAGAVIGAALKLLVKKLQREKFGAPAKSAARHDPTRRRDSDSPLGSPPRRPGSRHIPAGVRRQVWLRDQGRCAFVAKNGRRCAERGRLEFHHVHPFAAGGPATTGNIQLRCRAHNQHEADICFSSPPTGENAWGRSITRTDRVGPD